MPPDAKFVRGAKPTPRHVLAAATPFRPPARAEAVPAQFAVVPPKLSMWLNDQTGDCVTAEEAFAKAAWSVMNGLPELFVPDAEVKRWAGKYGWLDGAYLTEVMDALARDGFQVGGATYTDGPYKSVDYSDEAVLQAAIVAGPVKLGIDADALPSGAGNVMGWYALGGSPGQFRNEDHCVGACAFGPASFLFTALKVLIPAGIRPDQRGYLIFTWNTIGFVTREWIMSTVGEAWVRTPTTPQQPAPMPVPPPPVPVPPPPTPVPVPQNVTVTGKTQPFTFSVGNGIFGKSAVTIPGQTIVSTGTLGRARPGEVQPQPAGPVVWGTFFLALFKLLEPFIAQLIENLFAKAEPTMDEFPADAELDPGAVVVEAFAGAHGQLRYGWGFFRQRARLNACERVASRHAHELVAATTRGAPAPQMGAADRAEIAATLY